jgi:hypothetical protein
MILKPKNARLKSCNRATLYIRRAGFHDFKTQKRPLLFFSNRNVSAAETRISAAETRISAAETHF